MMEGWDLVCSLHIRGNVIACQAELCYRWDRTGKLRSMERVEQTYRGSGAVG